jgi:hypothetical protein
VAKEKAATHEARPPENHTASVGAKAATPGTARV